MGFGFSFGRVLDQLGADVSPNLVVSRFILGERGGKTAHETDLKKQNEVNKVAWIFN